MTADTLYPIPFPGEIADARERARIAVQIGREPRGDIGIVARCDFGLPGVIRTAPQLPDGSPFPTLYWLVCPVASRAVSRLESEGRMRDFEARLRSAPGLADEYRRAHAAYVERRASLGGDPNDFGTSAGGMPDRVKCLHALYAHEIAEANPIGRLARAEAEPLRCPAPCVEERDDAFERPAGHPGYR